MAEEWLTYSGLGERLGISSEAARQKALRYRWRRRTNNHGKAEVLVDLVEVREQMERFPPRKPKTDQPSDDRQTPEDQQSDAQMFAALDAHIETLKAMVAKAEAIAERERERADNERSRADNERGRADRLQQRVEELLEERTEMSDQQQEAVRGLERQIEDLRNIMEARAAEARRPWWRRLAG
jgi:chromosome segregation ATPase